MVCVGIDISKDKHDCYIRNAEGTVLADVFTIKNDEDGFKTLLKRIKTCVGPQETLKVGLEATGHYSLNIYGFLVDNDLPVFILNPLQTNLHRKGLSLRKTKTDRVDARAIADMLVSDTNLKSYSEIAYHNEELKSLTRYHSKQIKRQGELKQAVSRLVHILFPELETCVSSLHIASVYAMLSEFPGAHKIAGCNLTHLKKVLKKASRGRFKGDEAAKIRDAAKKSIGVRNNAVSLELKQTISLIQEIGAQIKEIEAQINAIMKEIATPITTIPGIGVNTAAVLVAEYGDFSKFDSVDKLLAYSGMSPSIYQSGKLSSNHSHMEKRGSHYLRHTLYNAASEVSKLDPAFKAYFARKLAEGKHYYVAISHVVRKLLRVIFALVKSGQPYKCTA